MGRTKLGWGLWLVLGTVLTGCGGGGGGGDDDNDDDGAPPVTDEGFTLRGTLQTANGTNVDGDVNDPNADYRANDLPSQAQLIPNPVTLGGYASAVGSGPPSSRFAFEADRDDWYRVELAAGQTISLFIGNEEDFHDLDLYLYRLFDDGSYQDVDAAFGAFPHLEVAREGEYLIRIRAEEGAGNYILAVGQGDLTDTMQRSPRLSDAFVPGQIVIRYRQEALASLAVSDPAAPLARRLAGDPATGSVLLELSDTALAQAAATGGDPAIALGQATLQAVAELNENPAVEWAEPNYLARASYTPADQLYPRQWHYPLINLPQAWDLSTGRRFDTHDPVIVAVLDTGINSGHPDLIGRLVSGYDFISDPTRALDGDGIDPDPEDPGDRSEPDGSGSFHGTHVAGIVAARAGNRATVDGETVTFGVVGSAFDARVMPLRVLGRLGEGTFFDIEQALRYAAGLSNTSGTVPTRRADVINLSLGSIAFSSSLQSAVTAAREAGVVVVAAAGNTGDALVEYPASFNGVISVGGVGQDRQRAPYSTFNRFVDVAAPGGNMNRDLDGDGRSDGVLSTWADDREGDPVSDFTYLQGTSMATPHMAGVVALMLAANPDLTPEDIDTLLASGALTDDLGDSGRDDEYGYGLINAFEAVAEAIERRDGTRPDPQPVLTASPPGLNFALDRTTIELEVSASGGDLAVAAPDSDAPWLTVTPREVDEAGLGLYRVRVSRDGLDDGLYTTEIVFANDTQTLRVPVIMQVSPDLSSRDIGPQYVLLVAPESGDALFSLRAQRREDGRYTYAFDGVPAGEYQIYAGSDLDNDGFICDEGESCGAWRTLDLPQRLEVDGDRSGLDFDSGFTAALPTSATLRAVALPDPAGIKALPR